MGGGQKNVHHPWPLALSTLSVRGRERVAGVAAKRTFTIPGPGPLVFHSWLFLLFTLLAHDVQIIRFLPGRPASLATATLPLLSAAPPSFLRSDLVADVPTRSSQRCVWNHAVQCPHMRFFCSCGPGTVLSHGVVLRVHMHHDRHVRRGLRRVLQRLRCGRWRKARRTVCEQRRRFFQRCSSARAYPCCRPADVLR